MRDAPPVGRSRASGLEVVESEASSRSVPTTLEAARPRSVIEVEFWNMFEPKLIETEVHPQPWYECPLEGTSTSQIAMQSSAVQIGAVTL